MQQFGQSFHDKQNAFGRSVRKVQVTGLLPATKPGTASADVAITVSFVLQVQEGQTLSEVIDSLITEQIAEIKSVAIGSNVTDLSGA